MLQLLQEAAINMQGLAQSILLGRPGGAACTQQPNRQVQTSQLHTSQLQTSQLQTSQVETSQLKTSQLRTSQL